MTNERLNPGESPEALEARRVELEQEIDESEDKIADIGNFSVETALREGIRHVFLIREKSMTERDLNIMTGDKYEDEQVDFLASDWTIAQARLGDFIPLKDFYRSEGEKIKESWESAHHLLIASAFFNLASALPNNGAPFNDAMLQEKG